jgi:hypothetical protein
VRTLKTITAILTGLTLTTTALAGNAETSATAGTRFDSGNAMATAAYDGRIGFARSNAQTGRVNAAKGVAVGVDKHGISLSVSTALATRLGPAVAANFNMTIGRDGDVSKSTGLAIAKGSFVREATAGGSTHAGRSGIGSTATATGKAPLGTVRVITRSRSD